MPRTIRPNYDSPKPLAYVNKVIGDYHRLPVELVRWADGYHTLIYDTGDIYEEHSIMIPYTNALLLGEWVRYAIGFAQAVRAEHGIIADGLTIS
ncbi:MAG: hypothetical protein PWP11_3281 [Thauera sp.]|nr:hypothetical protein [Thauera sp.]MDI3492004.1 hypothetical protein [Thauera sp.]